MQGLVIQPVRLALGRPAWRPAMAQQVTAAPTTPPNVLPPAEEKPAFIDSALVSLIFDVVGATSSGILAYAAAARKNKLAWVFGTMATLMTMKGFTDLYDVRKR